MRDKSRHWRGIWTILGALLAVVVLFALLTRQGGYVLVRAAAKQPEPFSAGYYPSVSDRFGIGLNNGITVTVGGTVRPAQIADYDVGSLHLGWYSDWSTNAAPSRLGGMHYAQVVEVRATRYPTNTWELTETVQANPSSLWLVGNEPEAKYGQGNRTPDEYAHIYHHVYSLIKGVDPSAWIAIGGVVEPTPLRLQWLEEALGAYEDAYETQMPVDVWNIHVQILQEKAGEWGAEIPAGLDATEGEVFDFSTETGYYDNANPELFRQLVTQFRQWMKAKGFQNKPLIVSEYGVLLPSTYIGYGDGYGNEAAGDQVLKTFMRETFDFLVNAQNPELGYPADDHRLVQQWLWYSLNDHPFVYDPVSGKSSGFNGALFDYSDPTRLTQFGLSFRDYMRVLLGYPRVLLPAVVRYRAPS